MVCEPIFHSLSQAKALEEARLSEATIRKFMDAVRFIPNAVVVVNSTSVTGGHRLT
jgi:hypothetical protein